MFRYGLCTLRGLIFLVGFLVFACQSTDEAEITIRWQDKRATVLSIPAHFFQNLPTDSLEQLVTVHLAAQPTAIAGQYQHTGDALVFEPLVPFTRGLHYTVWIRDKRLAGFTVPALAASDRPELLAIYPSVDSLPDNLLKIYLHFSRPMREGQSGQHVFLLKNGVDTLPGVFLNLQPELWNADRTMLTLWLDPGRIKRDLQPNRRLGAPLQVGSHYRLVVSGAWADEQGAQLATTSTKEFVATGRDSLSPKPSAWVIRPPQAGSQLPLAVRFGEPLDYYLLTETLRVRHENGNPVSGRWQIRNDEKMGVFVPAAGWSSGRYTLQIEARLEDLAGNNLDRPFDRDLTRSESKHAAQPITKLAFDIR